MYNLLVQFKNMSQMQKKHKPEVYSTIYFYKIKKMSCIQQIQQKNSITGTQEG